MVRYTKGEDMNIDADELFLKADQLIGSEDIVGARSVLNQIIGEYPDYGRAHNHLGWLYEHRLRYFDKAEEHYKAALRFSPDYPASGINYAYFLNVQNRYNELEDHLKKAMNIKGVSQAFVYNELGSVYEMQSKYTDAITLYKKAIQHSLNDENIKSYESSISRVEKKKEILL